MLTLPVAAWFLGLSVAVGPLLPARAVNAQETEPPPAETETEAPLVPAEGLNVDESKYDPPLTDKGNVDQWIRQNGELRFKQALKLESLSNADRETIAGAVKHYLYRMTLKEERDNLHVIVQKLIETINSRTLTTSIARNYANEEIVRTARDLLNQPRAVRLNALILAASLVNDPTAEPPRPFTGAAPLFVDVLDDPNQLVESKIWAVKGLARIVRDGDVPVSERNNAAVHLVAALSAPDALKPENWLYRLRIVDALGDTGLLYNLQRQPIVIDALVGVLANAKENWMVRSTASRSVTRIPWLAADNVNVPLVTYQICQLARQMAQARNNDLGAPHWKYCFINVYLSFKPHTPQERDRKIALVEQVTRPHLASSQPLVQSAYEAVMPVVNSVTATVAARPTSADAIRALDDWLKNNVPDDRKPTPSSQQVDQSEPRAKPMADTRSPS
jgi:hypothetical protein